MIFSPFSQADASVNRKYGGSGLGLSIAKNLVKLMQGEISASAREEGGSIFVFTAQFDSVPESQNVMADDIGLARGAPSKRFSTIPNSVDVLLVESNPFAREILKDLLATHQINPQEVVTPAGLQAYLESWLNRASIDKLCGSLITACWRTLSLLICWHKIARDGKISVGLCCQILV
jgi:hypothetical protein